MQKNELTPDAGTSLADLGTHFHMHELAPDAGTSLSDLGTHLQMHELSPDAGKSHEELMHVLATNALCHFQIKELTCICMNSPSDAGMSLADLGNHLQLH